MLTILRQAKYFALSSVAARKTDVKLDAPCCSITFDDVPISAFENAVPILLENKVPATFYVATGLSQTGGFIGGDQICALASQGFDMACHTFSHYRLSEGHAEELANDAGKNRQRLAELAGVGAPRDFSYPFGEVSLSAKRLLMRHYRTMRSVYPGINSKGADLCMLKANPIYSSSIDWSTIQRLINETVERHAWLIFYTHGVEAEPDSYGCRPQDLLRVIKECANAGLSFRSVRAVSGELVRGTLV